MTDDFPRNLRGPLESLAQRAPDADGILDQGMRCLVAGFLGCVPLVGPGIVEAMAVARETEFNKEFALLRAEIDTLEEKVGQIPRAEVFLQSPQGKEHVTRILRGLEQGQGRDHRRALATAYVSGVGFGRFEPDLVLMLDDTLARLNSYHTQVIGWCYSRQKSVAFKERFAKALPLKALMDESGHPTAVLQKVISDLAQAHVLLDTNVHAVGPHYGVVHFALSSFGITLAQYLEEPERFAGESCPIIEEPFPEARNIKESGAA